jgi:hypothetical protein
MRPETRGTLLLLAIALIGGTAGAYVVFGRIAPRLRGIERDLASLTKQTDELKRKSAEYQQLGQDVEAERATTTRHKKMLPRTEDSSGTYAYFNRIASQVGGVFNYDFARLDKGTQGNLNTSLYQLAGAATFSALFSFIRALEEWPLFYRIEKLDLKEARLEEQNQPEPQPGVSFVMEVRAFSDPSSVRDESADAGQEDPSCLRNPLASPFLPLILAEIPPNDAGLPELAKCTLKALTEDRAYIVDQKGNLVTLAVGDPVYLGYLTKIESAENRCQFTLNRGGWIENATLELDATTQPAKGENLAGKLGKVDQHENP